MWQLAVFLRNAGFERVEFPGQTTASTMPLLLEAPKN
jgi:hypothetical protein